MNNQIFRCALKNGKGLTLRVYYIMEVSESAARDEARILAKEDGIKFRSISVRSA